jgi:hypothetical protein
MNLKQIRIELNKMITFERVIQKEINYLQLRVTSHKENKTKIDPILSDKLMLLKNNLVEIHEQRDNLLLSNCF